MKKHAVIIGSGFGGLGSACLLAKAGYRVTVLEKNEQPGGRASVFSERGYTFDMGPSWYLMPDIFEHFFQLMGEKVEDHLVLKKLEPSYRIFYKDEDRTIDIFSDLEKDIPTFEMLEPGSGARLREYLKRAAYQYDVAKKRFLFKNYDSILDFLNWETAIEGSRLSVFSNMDSYVRKFFKTPAVQKIMQYTLVFLGSSPYNTPALYNIMSHIDFSMGVFYPQGGIYELVKALVRIAEKHGAVVRTHADVARILVEKGTAIGVELVGGERIEADIVISNADMAFTDLQLLPEESRVKDERYWKSRTLSPSAFIMYLGIDGRVPELTHHNLIFSKDWKKNFSEIFDNPQWPDDPSLYICAPSITDPNVAPDGKENLFVLVPIAPNLSDADEQLELYGEKILQMLETTLRIPNLRERIEYKKFFSVKDFKQRYNSFGGSALGFAHTLTQTAIFRPNNVNPNVRNLYYAGAGTNPGIGMPICLISAELAYKRIVGDKSSGPLTSLQR
ncbi:phytoene desaturase [Candidatus Uhrbacteria bacterium]|nr:phytoene desaturase [Candidatus Uhrbacteria bacterium]